MVLNNLQLLLTHLPLFYPDFYHYYPDFYDFYYHYLDNDLFKSFLLLSPFAVGLSEISTNESDLLELSLESESDKFRFRPTVGI